MSTAKNLGNSRGAFQDQLYVMVSTGLFHEGTKWLLNNKAAICLDSDDMLDYN